MAQTVFITGTSSGLGLAAVRKFAERGWNVAATMRRPDRFQIFADLPSVHVISMELTDSVSVSAAFAEAVRHFGHVDVLINNAGYCLLGPLESTSMEQIRQQYETNVFGLMNMTQAVLPHFRSRGSGRIINITSISADVGYPFLSAYGSAKAAVALFSEVLNVELSCAGIQVKAVHPGLFETEIFEPDKLKLGSGLAEVYQPLRDRFISLQKSLPSGDPRDCARVIYRAATDDRPAKVHYYAGRDATLLRRLRRFLGQDRAFSLIRGIFVNGPAWWLKLFLPRDGKVSSIDFSKIAPPDQKSGPAETSS